MHDVVLLVLSVLAVVILVRLSRIQRALDRLRFIEDRLADLRRDLRGLTGGTTRPPAAPASEAGPSADLKQTPVAAVASLAPSPAAARPDALAAPPPLPAPAPVRHASPPPATQPVIAPLPVTATAPAAADSRPPSKLAQTVADILHRIWQWILVGEEYRPQGVAMEYAVGTTWLMRVGIVAVVSGVGYFLKWSMDHGLLGPTARVAMSLTFGVVMLAGGMRLLAARRWHLLGQGFAGGGLATLYFSLYALGPLYHLVASPSVVFGLMVLVTVTAGILALAANSMLVAIFGIIGGFSTPLLLRTGEPQFIALYSYLVLLNLGVLGMGHLRQWRLLNYLSFVFTYALYVAASPTRYTPADFPVALSFLIAVFVIHSLLVLVYNLRRGLPATVLEIVHLALNAACFAGAAYDVIRDAVGRPYPALMTLALALYYVLHVLFFLYRRLSDRPLLITLLALAGFFTTLTMPLIMEQETLTIAWALQAFMFLWLGRRVDSAFLRQAAYALYVLTFYRLAVCEFPRFGSTAHPADLAAYGKALVARLWTFGTAIGSVAAAFFLELRQNVRPAPPRALPLPDTPDVAPASFTQRVFFWSAVAVCFLYLHRECYALFGFFLPWRPAALTLIWCVTAAAFLLLYRGASTLPFFLGLLFFAGGAVLKTLAIDLPGWGLCELGYYDAAYTPFMALVRWADLALVLALLLALAMALRGRTLGVWRPATFGYAALALFWLYTSLELNSLLHWKLREFQAGGISVLWTLFAFGFVAGGIWRNVRPLRFVGLGLFVVVVGKVLGVDLAEMPTIYRFGALLAIGALLLLGSFAYLRASKRFIVSLLLLALAAPSLAGPTPAGFPFTRPLSPPAAARSEMGAVVLDDELYEALDDGFANLRLFDGSDRETPFLVRRKTPIRTVVQLVPITATPLIESLKELDDNRLELRVTRDPLLPQPVALEFESGLRNFEKLVTVSGSTDGTRWTVLADREPIYDYSRYAQVRRARIPLAPGPFTQYRIELSNVTEKQESPLVEIVRQTRGHEALSESEATSFRKEPFHINRLTFYGNQTVTVTGEPETAEFRIGDMTVTQDEARHETLVQCATRRQPLAALKLLTDDDNFSRAVTVEGETGLTPATWQPLAHDRVMRIRIGRIRDEHLTISLPTDARYRRYRLRLHNEDNPPLNITGIMARQNLHELLFFPKPGQTYRLCWGGVDIAAPRYDIATVLAQAPAGAADPWRLGTTLQTSIPRTGSTWQAYSRKALVGALVVMAAVLLIVIARLARKVDLQ